jgi:RNA polymerase sporulation-specific sigma factor
MTDEILIKKFREGEKNALEILMTRYKPFVKSKIRPYYVVGGDVEDLIQEGMIGLYKAVLNYDEDRNAAFAAFAALCVVRQVQTAIKAAGRKKHEPLNEAGEILLDLPAGRANDPETLFLGREALRDAENFIKKNLSVLETRVLVLHMDGKSHAEIASALGKNLKSVDNTLQRIRKKIGKKFS